MTNPFVSGSRSIGSSVANNDPVIFVFDMTTRMIHLTRDSVCMADDGYEHRREISVPSGLTVKEIIRMVWEDYLREVGKRKWIAYSGDIYSGTQGQKLFRIDAAFPCKVDIYSGWDATRELPDKIYFKINYPETEIEDAEIKESFTLYRNGWLSRLFLISCLAVFMCPLLCKAQPYREIVPDVRYSVAGQAKPSNLSNDDVAPFKNEFSRIHIMGD